VDTEKKDREETGRRLTKLLRQSDYVGELEDGKMYALLANTSAKDATMVRERFEKEGVSCQIQEDVFV
jgi:GGDEF domain-containing protein